MGLVLVLYVYMKEWAVPTVTCGEIDLKRTANVHWDGKDAEGNRVAVKTSHAKDRSMILLWKWSGRKTQKQLCQLLVHRCTASSRSKRIVYISRNPNISSNHIISSASMFVAMCLVHVLVVEPSCRSSRYATTDVSLC